MVGTVRCATKSTSVAHPCAAVYFSHLLAKRTVGALGRPSVERAEITGFAGRGQGGPIGRVAVVSTFVRQYCRATALHAGEYSCASGYRSVVLIGKLTAGRSRRGGTDDSGRCV